MRRDWTWVLVVLTGGTLFAAEPRFVDDFEGDLEGWQLERPRAIRVVDTDDPSHGRALELQAQGDDVLALVRDSDGWGPLRIEADFQFPIDGHGYVGLVYNLTRDGNVSRLLYEEYRTALAGEDSIRIGHRHRVWPTSRGRPAVLDPP